MEPQSRLVTTGLYSLIWHAPKIIAIEIGEEDIEANHPNYIRITGAGKFYFIGTNLMDVKVIRWEPGIQTD